MTNMEAPKSKHQRIKLNEINSYLTCHLCKGYLIDATTISECLHSFCRSCIIKFLQDKSHCPVCEVIINKAKPNLKLDKTLQDIVYKLVPELFLKEMCRRQQFYQKHPQRATYVSPEQRGEDTERTIFNPRDTFSLSIEYISDDSTPGAILLPSSKTNIIEANRNGKQHKETENLMRRFLQCPGMCRVDVLKKFVCNKYSVDTKRFHIDILYKRVPLPDHYTLIDIAYIYSWKRNEPMKFFFRITDIKLVKERFDYYEPAVAVEAEPTSKVIKSVRFSVNEADEQARAKSPRGASQEVATKKTVAEEAEKLKHQIKNGINGKNPVYTNITLNRSNNTEIITKIQKVSNRNGQPIGLNIKQTVKKPNRCKEEVKTDKINNKQDDDSKFDSKVPAAKDTKVIGNNVIKAAEDVKVPLEEVQVPLKDVKVAEEDIKMQVKENAVQAKANKDSKVQAKDIDVQPKVQGIKIHVNNKKVQIKDQPKGGKAENKKLISSASKVQSLKKLSEANKVPNLKENIKATNLESDKKVEKMEVDKPATKESDLINIPEDRKAALKKQLAMEVDDEKERFLKSIELTSRSVIESMVKIQQQRPPLSAEAQKALKRKLSSPQKPEKLAKKPKLDKKPTVKRQKMKTPKTPPENLKTLLNTCKIPSSLSITCVNGDRETQIKPVINHIEIVKLPEPNQLDEDKQKLELEKVGTTMQPASSKDDEKPETETKSELSITITIEKPEVKEAPKAVGVHPNLPKVIAPVGKAASATPRSVQSFQRMFEEAIKKPEFTNKVNNNLAKISKPADTNSNNKRNILEIASQLYKKTKLQQEEKNKGKIAIPRLNQKKKDQTLANLHSASLGMNYSVSVNQNGSERQENGGSPKLLASAPLGSPKMGSPLPVFKSIASNSPHSPKLFANNSPKQPVNNLKIPSTHSPKPTSSPKLATNLTKPSMNSPKIANCSPKPIHSSPRPMNSSPKPMNSSPKPMNSSPRPMNASPKPMNSSPKPMNSPKAALHSPKPPLNSPKAQLISPKPATNSPKPFNSPRHPSSSPLAISPKPSQNSPKPSQVSPKPSQISPKPPATTASPGSSKPSPTNFDPNQILEKYNIQNLAQLTASLNFNQAPMNLSPANQLAAFQQAMLLKHFEMQNRQNWLSMNSNPLVQYEKYLQSLNANGQNHLLGNIKEN